MKVFTLFPGISNVQEISFCTPQVRDPIHAEYRIQTESSCTVFVCNPLCVCVQVLSLGLKHSWMFPGQSRVTLALCALCEYKVAESQRP